MYSSIKVQYDSYLHVQLYQGTIQWLPTCTALSRYNTMVSYIHNSIKAKYNTCGDILHKRFIITFKDIFYSFLMLMDFCYIYIYYRKFNAEFNKLIKPVGHRACFFRKVAQPPLPTILALFSHFRILTYQVL